MSASEMTPDAGTCAPVLVTGATGFIGGHLARRLAASGAKLRLLVRDPLRLAPELGTAEIVVGDLADGPALRNAARGTGLVFHCAANVATWDRWEHYQASNVQGVRNLLEAVIAEGPSLQRFVHVSSVDVYGFPDQPCDETRPANGGEFGYGRSKAQGEALVRTLGVAHAIPFAIIRPANVIGPGSQFIARIGKELQSGLMLTIDGGRANAGMLYVDNLLDCLLWAASAPEALGKCFNARDQVDLSWAEFLSRLRTAIRGRGLIANLPWPAAEAAAYAFEAGHRLLRLPGEPLLHRLLVRIFGRTCGHSSARLRAASGYTDRVGFDQALERSARWYLEQARSP